MISRLNIEEELVRSLLCESEHREFQHLMMLIGEGLQYFATNERTRRTFVTIQGDVLSRAPSYAPNVADWDYHSNFLNRSEWEKCNPFRKDVQPPGTDYGCIENPAMEFRISFERNQKAQVARVVDQQLCWNEKLELGKRLRTLQLQEKYERMTVENLVEDFLSLCEKKKMRLKDIKFL